MEIEELKTYSKAAQQALDRLMGELANGSRCTEDTLRAVVEDPNAHLYIVREEGQIVASACLCVAHTTEQQIGFVEAVVVSNVCRGKGYGRMLTEHLIAEAKRLKLSSLHLTSRPTRVAANALYRSLGFVLHETNCYQLKI